MSADTTGYVCPQCGSTNISVLAEVWMDAETEIADNDSAPTFDDNSEAMCRACKHGANLMAFDPDDDNSEGDTCPPPPATS